MNDVELIGAVVGITEVVKKLGLPAKFCPVFAILLGITLAVISEVLYGQNNLAGYFKALVRGTIFGTTATGLYAVGGRVIDKTVLKNASSKLETH